LPNDVFLPHEFVERARAHPRGEGTRVTLRRFEQRALRTRRESARGFILAWLAPTGIEHLHTWILAPKILSVIVIRFTSFGKHTWIHNLPQYPARAI